MWFRLSRSQWEKQKGPGNKRAMQHLVRSGQVPGILAYHQSEAIAWCSVAPRDAFPPLQRSRVLKPVDQQPVWSIVCLFLRKDYRGQGMTVELVRAAVAFAAAHGAHLVEGYPIDTDRDNYPVAFAPSGFVSTFRRAGFTEILRRSDTRPIMRFQIKRSARPPI